MSLAPEFAPEVFIPERARRSVQPVRRPVRRAQTAADSGVRALLVAAPRAAGTRSLVAAPLHAAPHRTEPHRTAPHRTAPHRTAPHRTPAPRVAPELIPSTGWSEPRRVAVARPPVTLIVRRSATMPSTALERSASPLRVTGRGAVVRAVAVALAALGLVLIAWLSAPSSSSTSGDAPQMPAIVTVEAGDTLWSLATRLAPGSDPREVVSDLRRVNSLESVTLQPGQVLRTR